MRSRTRSSVARSFLAFDLIGKAERSLYSHDEDISPFVSIALDERIPRRTGGRGPRYVAITRTFGLTYPSSHGVGNA